uniref:Uncharacterized protein n=1 Tax=Cacopsylla melanoneura TaxID=428564 RepID=A0A8D8W185_9HEMI
MTITKEIVTNNMVGRMKNNMTTIKRAGNMKATVVSGKPAMIEIEVIEPTTKQQDILGRVTTILEVELQTRNGEAKTTSVVEAIDTVAGSMEEKTLEATGIQAKLGTNIQVMEETRLKTGPEVNIGPSR